MYMYMHVYTYIFIFITIFLFVLRKCISTFEKVLTRQKPTRGGHFETQRPCWKTAIVFQHKKALLFYCA